MNPNWTDAKDWVDLIDHIWIGFVVLAAAAIPSWMTARNHKSIKDIKDQVVNGHENPMRFDLDRAIAAIDALGEDVRRLRKDLMAEEDHRRVQIAGIYDELEHRTGKRRNL